MLRKKKQATTEVTAEQIMVAMAEELESHGIPGRGKKKNKNLTFQEIAGLIRSGKIGTAFLTDELGFNSLDLVELSIDIELKVGINLGAESNGMLDPRPDVLLRKVAEEMAKKAAKKALSA
ncbi:hypothetical protein GYA13_03515 [Candidatus Kuenenbacteria bacterium]|nr:hypothetical protein [Candidatus Kuenenbacteria bacterium]